MAHGEAKYKGIILQYVCENILQLSKHKFASNVVEKCIIYSCPADKVKLVHAVVYQSNNKSYRKGKSKNNKSKNNKSKNSNDSWC